MKEKILNWLYAIFLRNNRPSMKEQTEYIQPDDPFYNNRQRHPSFYCKCGQHYYSRIHKAWIICNATGYPIMRGLDQPGAYNIPSPECCNGRGRDFNIHKYCDHPPHADCVCEEEDRFALYYDYYMDRDNKLLEQLKK